MMEKINISKKILNSVGKTNAKYNLIGEGDRVLLGLSGGKDSMLLAAILSHMQAHAPFKFEFQALTIHYGLGEDFAYLQDYCKRINASYEIYNSNIAQTINEKRRENSSYCSFCSRLRRGALYSYAKEHGYNKVAIAHHLDDAVESFFMNLTYNGALRSLSPIYKAENGLYLIRPLINIREIQSIDFIKANNLTTAPDCNCPAKQPTSDKPPIARAKTKEFLKGIEEGNKYFFKSLKNALQNLHIDSFGDERYLNR